MITETQIIEAAKECGARFAPRVWDDGMQQMFTTEQTIQFANHFYKQGLLDAADRCANDSGDQLMNEYHAANIRQMAEEVKP